MPTRNPDQEFLGGWFGFPGGLKLVGSPESLQPGELIESENHLLNRAGLIVSRGGIVKKNSGSLNSSEFFSHLVDFTRRGSDSGDYFIGFTNQGRILKISVSGAYTQVATGYGNDLVWETAVWQDLLFASNAVNKIQAFDGSSFANAHASAPIAKDLEYFNGKMWAIDDTKLYGSKDNTVDWTTGGPDALQFQVAPDSGGKLTLIRRFFDIMVIGKERQIHRLDGNTITTFAVNDIGIKVGVSSPKGAESVGNNLWLLDNTTIRTLAGVQQFGDLRESNLNSKVAPFFDGSESFSGLNSSSVDNFRMAYMPDSGIVYFTFPGKGNTINTEIITADVKFDANNPAWLIQTSDNMAALLVRSISGEEQLWGADYNGNIFRMLDPTTFKDNAVSYTKKFLSGASLLNTSPTKFKNARHFQLSVLSDILGDITIKIGGPYNNISNILENIETSTSLWDVAVWDVDNWAGTPGAVLLEIHDLNIRDRRFQYGAEYILDGRIMFGEAAMDGVVKSGRVA